MAITTKTGHVKQALDFINSHQGKLYFEFARKNDWVNPAVPDAETDTVVSLDDPQAFLKIDKMVLCRETGIEATQATNTDKAIVYKNKMWEVVDTSSILDKSGNATSDAKYVCLIGTLPVEALAPFKYTQIGVVDSPKFATNLTNVHEVSNNQVSNPGTLLFYDNRMQEAYTNKTSKVVKYMLKF